jgi:hypothetical protein
MKGVCVAPLITYCGGTLTFLTLIQIHTISTGMNGRNLGPVSTTNGLTEQTKKKDKLELINKFC